MKDMSFLKENYFTRRGIFDNQRIFENTETSYLRSVKYNYGIELDVRMLKDGTIICFHDENTKRILHMDEKIDSLTYDELTYLSKIKIPTIEEALQAINGSVPVLVQIVEKTRKNKLEIELAKVLDEYRGEFAIESFHLKPLKWFYKNRPGYILGYMIGWKNLLVDTFWKKYDFMNIKIDTYPINKIKHFRSQKVVLGWRVMTKEDLEKNKITYDNLVCDNILDIM